MLLSTVVFLHVRRCLLIENTCPVLCDYVVKTSYESPRLRNRRNQESTIRPIFRRYFQGQMKSRPPMYRNSVLKHLAAPRGEPWMMCAKRSFTVSLPK